MKVYEMIFSTGIEDKESFLYFSDNIKNRMDFISKIKAKIILDINKNEKNIDILNFYNQIYFEDYSNIEKMQDEFIKNRYSKLDDYTFLEIKEKNVI